jgi:hypothetical protein
MELSISAVELRMLWDKLSNDHCGGVVDFDVGGGKRVSCVFYLKAPVSPLYVFLCRNVVVPVDSSLLADMAAMFDRKHGRDSKWRCQKKNASRLRAYCAKSGPFRKGEGTGNRIRASAKTGCTAAINTFPVPPQINEAEAAAVSSSSKSASAAVELSQSVTAACAAAKAFSALQNSQFVLTCISSVKLEHNGHGVNHLVEANNLTARRCTRLLKLHQTHM